MVPCVVCETVPSLDERTRFTCRCGRLLVVENQYAMWDSSARNGPNVARARLYDACDAELLSVVTPGLGSHDFSGASPERDVAVARFLEYILLAAVIES